MNAAAELDADDEVLTEQEPEGEAVSAEDEGQQDEQAEGADTEGGATDEADEGAGDDDELVVSIGDEQAESAAEDEKAAPPWVKDLRKQNREMRRELARLREQSRTAAPQAQEVAEPLPPKPKASDEGIDFDSEKLEAALDQWHEKKREHDAKAEKRRQAQEAEAAAWQQRLAGYKAAASKLKVRDFEDAEAAALDVLSPVQQSIIVHGAARPELLIYAIGKSPAKAKELASITDPVKFAIEVGKLEKDVKLTPKSKTPPPPEKRLTSGVPGAKLGDSRLAELKRKAEQSGDYSAYFEAKRKAKATA